jgi:prepilin-type N-terminal cleavage/methylation domain-containing protein
MSNFSKKEAGKHEGFTIIELVVVVAIIGILTAIVIAASQTVRSRGRDAQVRNDVSRIILALERYRNNNSNYRFPPGTYGSTGYCLKTSGTCQLAGSGPYNANPAIINLIVPDYISSVGTIPGDTTLTDSYIFFPSITQSFGGIGPGSWLIWPQEKMFAANDCKGYTSNVKEVADGKYYCFQLLK